MGAVAMIEVEGPDGQVHQFPEGTDPQTINAQMSQRYGGKPGQLAPSPQATPNQPSAGMPTPEG